MLPNLDLDNSEVPLCLVFLSKTLHSILINGFPIYISVVWTLKSVLTRKTRRTIVYKLWEKLPLHH